MVEFRVRVGDMAHRTHVNSTTFVSPRVGLSEG